MPDLAGLAFDQLSKAAERKKLLLNRTPDQQKVIKYFIPGTGCLSAFSSGITDEQYEGMVMAKAKQTDFKQKALAKIGIDESQVVEIEPVHFEFYNFDEKAFIKAGLDGKYRSSGYQISWIFFSSTQVYVYQYTFSMIDDSFNERTDEYFYKDIVNFSTSTDRIEKATFDKPGCRGNLTVSRKTLDSTKFVLIVPSDKFGCSMEQTQYTERAIQGMKAKLREKKG